MKPKALTWRFPLHTGPYRPSGNKFLDEVRASNPVFNMPRVRTLKDMSEAEIAALEKQYGCKVKR